MVTSTPAGARGRAFTLETSSDLDVPELPAELAHEKDLVELMAKRGFQLTMVGGGSRIDEVRRFYFRRKPTGD